jgi:hypothetical protein
MPLVPLFFIKSLLNSTPNFPWKILALFNTFLQFCHSHTYNLCLSELQYILDALHRADMIDCNPYPTPIDIK